MNVFVLCTGRCGSVTFVEACKHIQNYSSAHEGLTHAVGYSRFAYPANHIEADNRLSWLLGRLDEQYGDAAYYVHLRRDLLDTARSFQKRYDAGIMHAYRTQILMRAEKNSSTVDSLDFCVDYCRTVDSNIELFLKNKTNKMNFYLENAGSDFRRFWDWIGAQGDFEKSMAEWDVKHNVSKV